MLEVAPWLAISLVLTALSTEYLPANTLHRLFKTSKSHPVPVAMLYTVFLPATPVYKIVIAALSRRNGSKWAPALTFIGAGAGAGFAAVVVTMILGWKLTILRAGISLLFGLMLALVLAKYFEDQLATTGMDFEVESLLIKDFVEAKEQNLDRVETPTIKDLWSGLVRVSRIAIPWFVLSLFLATLLKVIAPDSVGQALFGGNFAVIWMSLLGIPFYFVGGAEIPIAYVLLSEGMGAGGAITFMLAAPLINVPVFVMMSRWLGYRMAAAYMIICWLFIVLIGFIVNFGMH
jgi:uncharacterized membrane protein YraQ (UPF0718 family)